MRGEKRQSGTSKAHFASSPVDFPTNNATSHAKWLFLPRRGVFVAPWDFGGRIVAKKYSNGHFSASFCGLRTQQLPGYRQNAAFTKTFPYSETVRYFRRPEDLSPVSLFSPHPRFDFHLQLFRRELVIWKLGFRNPRVGTANNVSGISAHR